MLDLAVPDFAKADLVEADLAEALNVRPDAVDLREAVMEKGYPINWSLQTTHRAESSATPCHIHGQLWQNDPVAWNVCRRCSQ
jgi:hypothetical protein